MAKVYVKQGGRYLPIDEETVKQMSGDVPGRGSAQLKKRMVRIGEKDGLPVYELRDASEPTPTPTPEAPRPTPGPQSMRVPAPETVPGVAPYTSPTAAPQFSLGVFGAPAPTPAPKLPESRGAPSVVRGKAATAGAAAKRKAQLKGAVKRPLPGKPLRPDTDAKRRWEEKYAQQTIPPEPINLRETEPKVPEAPPVKPDPFEKYKVPVSPRETDLPPEPLPETVEAPPVKPDPFEKYKPPVSPRETDLPPEGERTYDSLSPEEKAELGDNPPPPPIEGEGEGAGDVRFGPGKRGFNEGELPPEAAPKPGANLEGGAMNLGGEDFPWTKEDQRSKQTSRTSVDPELKGEYLARMETGQVEAADALQGLRDAAAKDPAEADRLAFAAERKGLLDAYTKNLDAASKARFMDALVKNLGKIAAGAVGLSKGVDVAKHYKYEGADTDAMRKDAEDLYAAGIKDVESREKAKKEVTDRDLEKAKLIFDASTKLTDSQLAQLGRIMEMEKLAETEGINLGTTFITPQNMAWMVTKRGDEQANKLVEERLRILQMELQGKLGLLGFEGKLVGAKSNVDAAKARVQVTESEKQGQQEESTYRPETLQSYNKVLSYINPKTLPSFVATKEWLEARARGDVKKAASILANRIAISAADWRIRDKELAEEYAQAAQLLTEMTPYLENMYDLDNINATFARLASEDGPLGYRLGGKRRTESRESGQSKSTTTTKPLPPAPKAPTPTPSASAPSADTKPRTIRVGGRDMTVKEVKEALKKQIEATTDPAVKEALKEKLKQYGGM